MSFKYKSRRDSIGQICIRRRRRTTNGAKQFYKVHLSADARISDHFFFDGFSCTIRNATCLFSAYFLFWFRDAVSRVRDISMFIFTLGQRTHAFRMAHLIWFTTNCKGAREFISVTIVMPIKTRYSHIQCIAHNRNHCNNLWNSSKIDERTPHSFTMSPTSEKRRTKNSKILSRNSSFRPNTWSTARTNEFSHWNSFAWGGN